MNDIRKPRVNSIASRTVKALFGMACFSSLMSGCVIIPLPFTSDKSPQFSAKVLEEDSDAPIENARVWVGSEPKYYVTTDSNGEFLLKPRSNFHVLFYANLSFGFGLPAGTYSQELHIEANNFFSRTIDFSDYRVSRKAVDHETSQGYSNGPFHHKQLHLNPIYLTANTSRTRRCSQPLAASLAGVARTRYWQLTWGWLDCPLRVAELDVRTYAPVSGRQNCNIRSFVICFV